MHINLNLQQLLSTMSNNIFSQSLFEKVGYSRIRSFEIYTICLLFVSPNVRLPEELLLECEVVQLWLLTPCAVVSFI